MGGLKINKTKIVCGGIIILFFTLDRFFKFLIVKKYFQESVPIIKNILTFESHINTNVAFSIPLQGKWLEAGISIILLGLLYYLLWLAQKKYYHYFFALLILILGAASNLYDRFLTGGVIDYIHIKYITVLNLADVMIVSGILILFYFLVSRKY